MTAILPGSARASVEEATTLLRSSSSSNQSQAAFVWDHRSGGIRQRKSFEYRHHNGGGSSGGDAAAAAAVPPARSSVSRMGPAVAAASHQSVLSGILALDRSSAPTGSCLVLDARFGNNGPARFGSNGPASTDILLKAVPVDAAVNGPPEEEEEKVRGGALCAENVTAGSGQWGPCTDVPHPSRVHMASLDAERPPPPSGSNNNRGAPDRARNKTFCSSLTPRCVWGCKVDRSRCYGGKASPARIRICVALSEARRSGLIRLTLCHTKSALRMFSPLET